MDTKYKPTDSDKANASRIFEHCTINFLKMDLRMANRVGDCKKFIAVLEWLIQDRESVSK